MGCERCAFLLFGLGAMQYALPPVHPVHFDVDQAGLALTFFIEVHPDAVDNPAALKAAHKLACAWLPHLCRLIDCDHSERCHRLTAQTCTSMRCSFRVHAAHRGVMASLTQIFQA